MKYGSFLQQRSARRPAALLTQLLLIGGSLAVAGCAGQSATVAPAPASTAAPTRVGLKAGLANAEQAQWNMTLASNSPSPAGFAGVTNSDLAFSGNYVLQGNYNGFMVWDIANPAKPVLRKSFLCPASQSDVSIYKNLLFVSGEGQTGRLDCGTQGVSDTVSAERLRGIRIFDVTDLSNPKYIANVQTCRGSHTHTVVNDPKDKDNVYIYVSGSAGVRSPNELPGCSALAPDQDANSALFRIEVIKVPLTNPQAAKIVSSPRIFTGLAAPARHAETPQDVAAAQARAAQRPAGAGGAPRPGGPPGPRTGPSQCHDITVYPSIGLAGGACGGYGLLLDISDVANPVRIDAAADSNFSFWHSATFSNDGSKMLFTDEWGGGSAPRCRSTDKPEWGANAIFTIENRKLKFKSYYKMPAPQTATENCVAHNGSMVPIPGRDVMVQGWYQGGISIFEWTNPEKPQEIAYFDRGPVDSTRLVSGGSWSVYWYNGQMISSEIARGLDVFELQPSEFISRNEIDAAKTVKYAQLNAQEQPRMVWPPSFSLARAFVDQLERSKCLTTTSIASTRQELARAERANGMPRRDQLTMLATTLDGGANTSCDAPRVAMLTRALRELAGVQP